jgi:hypothetical protein
LRFNLILATARKTKKTKKTKRTTTTEIPSSSASSTASNEGSSPMHFSSSTSTVEITTEVI